ncbi:MAG: hypothetical protein IJB52_04280 [Clostridia bacterium]|nr:hypothetical protein [Clostridia bacterium]
MERAMLEKKIKWAMDRVSTDTLIWVYDILCNNIDFTMGAEQPTVRKNGNSRNDAEYQRSNSHKGA